MCVLTDVDLVPDRVDDLGVPLDGEKDEVVGGTDHQVPLPQVRLPQPARRNRCQGLSQTVVSCWVHQATSTNNSVKGLQRILKFDLS